MIKLEEALSTEFGSSPISTWVFNRTGNHLKEFAYYIHDRELFIARLNEVLSTHSRYPIEVNFYDDSNWSEYKGLLKEFSAGDNDV